MSGLIYKDLLCQMKTLKTFVVVLVVYGALAVGGLWDTNILTTLMFVIVIMLPINIFPLTARPSGRASAWPCR